MSKLSKVDIYYKNHNNMRILKITLVAMMSIAVCSTAVADNYFEDDIYYDASKAKKKKEKNPDKFARKTKGRQVNLKILFLIM